MCSTKMCSPNKMLGQGGGVTSNQRTTCTPPSGKIERLADGAPLFLDFFLQQRDGVDQLFWSRRAAGNVDVDRDHLVHALHQRIVLKYPARRGAGSHRQNPLRLRHL